MTASAAPKERDVLHVYPVDDVLEHETDDSECWCAPVYEYPDGKDGTMLVIHSSIVG